jgi:hypothetical protein
VWAAHLDIFELGIEPGILVMQMGEKSVCHRRWVAGMVLGRLDSVGLVMDMVYYLLCVVWLGFLMPVYRARASKR